MLQEKRERREKVRAEQNGDNKAGTEEEETKNKKKKQERQNRKQTLQEQNRREQVRHLIDNLLLSIPFSLASYDCFHLLNPQLDSCINELPFNAATSPSTSPTASPQQHQDYL